MVQELQEGVGRLGGEVMDSSGERQGEGRFVQPGDD